MQKYANLTLTETKKAAGKRYQQGKSLYCPLGTSTDLFEGI